MSHMETRLANDTPEAALVQLTDTNGVDHRFAIDKTTGSIAVHQYNQYPSDLAECTPEQRRMVEAARSKARYTVHYETDANIVRPTDLPENLRDGIRVVESMSDGEFLRYFRTYYDQLQDPPVNVDRESVTVVAVVFYLDGDRLEYATSPAVRVETAEGKRWEYDNPADSMAAPDRDPEVLFRLPPQDLSIPFGEEFRSFLIDHLRCQLRDVHWAQGDPIPEDCCIEGPGNPDVDRLREALDVDATVD